MQATVEGQTNGDTRPKLLEACQQRVDHAISLNRAGRQFLRENVHCPKHSSLESFWVSRLIDNLDNHSILYSWICVYPDIFVRAARIGVERKRALVGGSTSEESPSTKQVI